MSLTFSNFFSSERVLSWLPGFKVNPAGGSCQIPPRTLGRAAHARAGAHAQCSVASGLSAMADANAEVVAVPASGAANGLSNGAGATPAQPNNPLSRKLHKILETRLDNDKVTAGGGAAEWGRGLCPGSGSFLPGSGAAVPAQGRSCLP